MFPVIYDDNISTMRDEGVDPSRWTISTPGSGSIIVNGSCLKISTNGGGTNFYQALPMPPASEDFIIYIRLKAEYAQGKASVVHLCGDDGKARIGFALGYSYLTKTLALGQLSVTNIDGSSKCDFASINYSDSWCDLAIHGCRDLGVFKVYLRDAAGEWLYVFGGQLAQIADITYILAGSQFSLSAPSYLLLDHVLVCHPNMVSIGDSICAGFNVATPADAVTCWQKYAKLYPWLRNDLVVNLGVAGNSSEQIRSRIVPASFEHARLVFLHASSNDFRLDVSLQARTQTTQLSISQITDFGASCILINGIYPNIKYTNMNYIAETDYQKAWWEVYAQVLSGLSGKIDIMLCLKGVVGPYLAEALGNLADGKHPNMPGHVLVGRFIKSRAAVDGCA